MKNEQLYTPSGLYYADAYIAIKQIPDNSIDLIITDPPYELSVYSGAGAYGKSKIYESIKSISQGFDFSILDEFIRVMKRINIYIWCSKRQLLPLFNYFVNLGCRFNIISWHKTNVAPKCCNSYMQDTEYCLYFRERGVHLQGTAKSKTTYYVTSTNKGDVERFGHPTPKPLQIIQNFVINSSNVGDVVLDPFAGSAVTAVAAKNTGRQYILFENDEEQFKNGSNRLNNIQANGQMTIFTM